MRYLVVFCMLMLSSTLARAEFIVQAPDTYTPGTDFQVALRLSPVTQLGLYNLDLVFRTAGPVTGGLSVLPPTAAVSGYVFPTKDFFLATPQVGGTDYRLSISDFTLDFAGTNVLVDVNDRISTLTVRPATTLTGPIRLFVDPSSSFLDSADGSALPLGSISSLTINATVPPINTVPAPPGICCFAIGAMMLLTRKRSMTTSL